MRVLVVDDEPDNLDILTAYITQDGGEPVPVGSGSEAIRLLEEDVDYNAIVLDRMMPAPDGMEVLRYIMERDDLKAIPVIMATAAGQADQIREGIEAGVYYYLVKPFNRSLFVAILHRALSDRQLRRRAQRRSQELGDLARSCRDAVFRFRTLEEAKYLSTFLAEAVGGKFDLALGLKELLVNAVEHGNLELSYSQKQELLLKGEWEKEVSKRLISEGFSDRYAEVRLNKTDTEASIVCKDMGKGFDWRPFLEMSPELLLDPNGRGIAMARTLGMSKLTYDESGTRWSCTWPLQDEAKGSSDEAQLTV
jgi:DNA-binding response OmpR family regulator